MKLGVYIGILLICFSCNNEKDTYLKKYPFFENVQIYKENNTVAMHNFKTRKNKNGLEYLLNKDGSILEVRNWQNNALNGYSFLYSANSKINVIAHFVNDTLEGSYFELDTISGKLLRWADKINYHDGEESAENQNINFINGKIDLNTSWFHRIEKINDSTIHISLPTKHQLSLATINITETSKNGYIFNIDSIGNTLKSKDQTNFYYLVRNKQSKYVTGTISYSLKPGDISKYKISGRICYFKFKL